MSNDKADAQGVIGLLGATGFVGGAIYRSLVDQGWQVKRIATPRVATGARDLSSLVDHTENLHQTLSLIRSSISDCAVVINAAGMASALSSGDALFGANALLPYLIGRGSQSGQKIIHVSSAAVQGRRLVLDESPEVSPFSPYSESKALGESAIHHANPEAIVYRPTSVHGPGRRVTSSLLQFASSRLSSVADPGSDPTPQILVEDVAEAVAYMASPRARPPAIVLHPWGGLTTSSLLYALSDREPRKVPRSVARAVLSVSSRLSFSSKLSGTSRRLEILWLGQQQEPGWLSGRWTPTSTVDAWTGLRRTEQWKGKTC